MNPKLPDWMVLETEPLMREFLFRIHPIQLFKQELEMIIEGLCYACDIDHAGDREAEYLDIINVIELVEEPTGMDIREIEHRLTEELIWLGVKFYELLQRHRFLNADIETPFPYLLLELRGLNAVMVHIDQVQFSN